MTDKEKAKELASVLIGEDQNQEPLVEILMEMAQWKEQQTINKACEWLKAQKEMIGISFQEDFIERFRKAME